MRGRRRLTLQLTPLLDLLLIVIFAQYMDVQEREAKTVGEAQRIARDYDQAAADLTRLQQAGNRRKHKSPQPASNCRWLKHRQPICRHRRTSCRTIWTAPSRSSGCWEN